MSFRSLEDNTVLMYNYPLYQTIQCGVRGGQNSITILKHRFWIQIFWAQTPSLPFMACCFWISHLTALYLCFYICSVGIIIVPTLLGCFE